MRPTLHKISLPKSSVELNPVACTRRLHTGTFWGKERGGGVTFENKQL